MKIGLYSPYLDTLGGGEKYMFSAALCLSKEHDVSFFWDKTNTTDLKKLVEEKFNLDLTPITFVSNIFSPQLSFLSRIRESRKYDAIIVLSDGSIPVIQTKLFLHFQSPITWVKKNSIKNRLKMVKAAKVFCNSQFTKSYIDKTYHCNSVVIYPPVEIHDAFIRKKENIIFNVGRYGINTAGSSFKKQDILVEEFKHLIDSGVKDWRFILAVNLKENESVEALAELKRNTKGYPIEIIENPNFETLWTYYGKAKIYWHAAGYQEDLEKHPDRAEHFGISTVEAMGMGAVPVVINAGGQTEIVVHGENGFLWNTSEELKKYTLSLIHDEKRLREMADKGNKDALRFDISRFSNEINHLLK